MSAAVNVVDLDSAAAERRAERIRLRLDSIADNYQAVLPMIREAIEKRDDLALGYRSVSDYVSDRFGGALNNLGIEVRREVVRELTEAGLSTRAIAPVVSVSQRTVITDKEQVSSSTHLPNPELKSGPSLPSAATMLGNSGPNIERKPAPVVGIDGKRYSRSAPTGDRRRPLTDTARDLGLDLRKLAERAERFGTDDRFARNKVEVAAHLRHHLDYALTVLADLNAAINSQGA